MSTGHNSGVIAAPKAAPENVEKLRKLLDRIVTLEEEKRGTAEAIKDIYTEADSAGYSKKALREMVRREMETAEQRAAREQTASDIEIMAAALGDFVSSPLGDAAMRGARR